MNPIECPHRRKDDISEQPCIQCYITSLEIKVTTLHGALKNLVRLKKYKDQHGKDAHYIVEQPLAWEKAEKALKKYETKPSGVIGHSLGPQENENRRNH